MNFGNSVYVNESSNAGGHSFFAIECKDGSTPGIDNVCIMANSNSQTAYMRSPMDISMDPIFTFDQRPPAFQPANPF